MNSEQLFQMMEGIDDEYILEAEENRIPHLPWKILAAAAAVAVAAAGAVWFSGRMLSRAPHTVGPQDLSAPIVSAEPNTPDETSPPGTGTQEPVYITPNEPTPTQPAAPENPGGVIGDPGSGGSGSGLPGFGWQGAGLPGSNPSGDGSNGLPGQGSLPGLPSLPGSGGSGSAGLPGFGGASVSLVGEYRHSSAGDYLVFRSPILGVPVVTKNITGQIVDGYYAGTVSGLPFGQSIYVELHVHEDGSYDLDY